MEQLYPTNIIERRYPILREQREKAEREESEERVRNEPDVLPEYLQGEAAPLHQNAPAANAVIGGKLNTVA